MDTMARIPFARRAHGIALALMLAACSQSPQAADVQTRIAAADARSAAAEQRIKIAAQTSGGSSPSLSAMGISDINRAAANPLPLDAGNASVIGVNTVPYRDRNSGPDNDIP